MEKKDKSFSWNNYFTDVEGDKKYRGECDKDKKNWEGLGELKMKDGSLYQGFISNRLYNGKGRLTSANGDIFQGNWKDGKIVGKGVFYNKKE